MKGFNGTENIELLGICSNLECCVIFFKMPWAEDISFLVSCKSWLA